ncbi:MAG: hypothetical protein EOP84_01760 [Verrucomicrobiaceae bacterium]|nr:MAG: hypothetical protein EOP84_01760 [Verrucomicrobiaceae bacterium]
MQKLHRITYSDLAFKLQDLERRWRSKPKNPRLPTYSDGWVRGGAWGGHNVQYFALSRATRDITEPLPIVVTVGINYTQDPSTIPDQTPQHSKILMFEPRVEDSIQRTGAEETVIQSFNSRRNEWVKACLASPRLGTPLLKVQAKTSLEAFHLVMTNLSPWITTVPWVGGMWDTGRHAVAADLLANPPYRDCDCRSGGFFPHLYDLYELLDSSTAVWIGHGKKAVWSHFRLFVERCGPTNWLLAPNLSRPIGSQAIEGLLRSSASGESSIPS